MITLILFHVCGIGRVVRSFAWSLLIIGCVYTSSIALFGSEAHAQSQESTVLYDSLSALEVLQYHDQYDQLFQGNNTVVFDLLKETYRTGDNLRSFNTFITAFDAISQDQWKMYSIDKNEILVVLKAIAIVAEKNGISTPETGMNTSSLPYGYTITKYPKAEGTLIVFETKQKSLPKRMNRYFGDGTQYSCERNQCRRFNHMYTNDGTYIVDVYSSIRIQETEKERFRVIID